mgnify:CR=1 FL=1
MTRGLFISFEGIDGAGKSSHVQAVADAFTQARRQVVLTREPGGTPLAEKLRDMVLHDSMDPLSEVLLMFAARRDHLQQVIEPALARGDVVVCDRFTDATFAYQGGGRGVSAEFIEQLARTVHAGLEPDLTLLLDLPVEEGLRRAARRRADRGDHTDRFESETVAFFDRVRARYLEIATADPGRVRVLDATKSAAALAQDAVDASAPLLAGEQRPR